MDIVNNFNIVQIKHGCLQNICTQMFRLHTGNRIWSFWRVKCIPAATSIISIWIISCLFNVGSVLSVNVYHTTESLIAITQCWPIVLYSEYCWCLSYIKDFFLFALEIKLAICKTSGVCFQAGRLKTAINSMDKGGSMQCSS